MIKVVNGEHIEMTPTEEQELQARQAQAQAEEQQVTRLYPSEFHRGLKLLRFDSSDGIEVCSNGQIQSGNNLRGQIQSVLDVLTDKELAEAESMMEYATSFDRGNDLINSLATALGMGETDVDDFFEMSKNEAWK